MPEAVPGTAAGVAAELKIRKKGQSLWKDAWRRLRKNRFAMGGLVVMVVVSFASVAAPWITPMAPDYGQPWLRHARAPGFEHPAVLAEIRFDNGEAPFVPERIPPRIARYMSNDGTIVYRLTEVEQHEYRIRLRRGKIRKIQEGATSIPRVEVAGALAVARLLDSDGQPTGPELRNVVLEPKKPVPEALKDYAKEKILILQVNQPRTPEPETIEVVIADGKVTSITRGGVALDQLRAEGRYVEEIRKDGNEQRIYHLLGTDDVGRDIWSRVVYGGQVSLMVGAVATIVSILIGVIYGAVAGYQSQAPMTLWNLIATLLGLGAASGVMATNAIFGLVKEEAISFAWLFPAALALFLVIVVGGAVLAKRLPWQKQFTTSGEFMMRIVDILYALPFMFLVILLMISYGRDLITLFVALGCVQWLMMARIVRGQVLSLKEKEFIEAARMCGSGHASIVFRHLIPNTLGVVVVYATLTVPAVILQESFLSFIGLTVEFQGRTLDSWGSLVDQGRQALTASGGKWWILVFPSAAMAVTLFSLNFLGDGLRDALDPKLKGRN